MSWNTVEIEIVGAERLQVLLWRLPSWRHDWIYVLIKFLGDKLLYGHVPDPFPQCGIGSGHARLPEVMEPIKPIVTRKHKWW